MIGRLLYLTIPKPNICYAVNKLNQYMSSPHLDALYHLLRYVKSSPRQGLLFSTTSTLSLKAYANTDWGNCLDTRSSPPLAMVFS